MSYPKDMEHEGLARRAANYVVIGTELFRHSASSGTLSKCISQQDGVRLLGEIHSGICGNHAGASTLVGKAFRSGSYWPTALADTQVIVRRCPGCQFFSKQQHVPAQALQMIPPSWPFACWGLNSAAQGGYTHIYPSPSTNSPSGSW